MIREKITKDDLPGMLRILKGKKNGRLWQMLVVDRNAVNDYHVHDQLIDMGVEVITCGIGTKVRKKD